MKNRIFRAVLAMALFTAALFPAAFADGDVNVDHGGGGTEIVTGDSYWMPGDDGVRVSVVYLPTNSVRATVDFTDIDTSKVQFHYEKKSKLNYMHSAEAEPIFSKYQAYKPDNPLPTIISSGGSSSLAAIKAYFGSRGSVQNIADKTGYSYDRLTGGDYKLLLEPIAYFKYNGTMYAMTATEAALFDQKVSGDLKKQLGYVTHQNLPLSMFLERDDLTITAWSGARTGLQYNSSIINFLGCGVVRFNEEEPAPADITYHTKTYIYLSAVVTDTGGQGIPKQKEKYDTSGTVVFTWEGQSFPVSFSCAPGGSTWVWTEVYTGSTPRTVNVGISTSRGSLNKSSYTAAIVDLEVSEPPDPQAEDSAGTIARNVTYPSITPTRSWYDYDATWIPHWIWIDTSYWVNSSYIDDEGQEQKGPHLVEDGYWKDDGEWAYYYHGYSYSARVTVTVTAADEVPTAIRHGTLYEMKSGYGIYIKARCNVAPANATGAQTVRAYFPEFDYQTYWRNLEPVGRSSIDWQLPVNFYSFKGARSHYTPWWTPDGTVYEPLVVITDDWCPAGECSNYDTSRHVTIDGGSAYDDWDVVGGIGDADPDGPGWVEYK